MEVKIQSVLDNKFISVDSHILTSPYSLEDETKRFIKGIDFRLRNFIVIVFGLGIGKYLFELDQMLHSSNTIIIVEPLHEVIEAYEYSKYKINSERIHIIDESSNDVIEFLEKNGLNNRFKIVYGYMNYRNVFFKKYKCLVEIVRNDSIKSITNEATIKKFDQEFTRNIVENFFINEFDIPINAMKEMYADVPALIVSGGPSLEKHLNFINDFHGIIISGGRTVENFLSKGIHIDFMVSVDPGNPAFQLIEDIPSDVQMPPLFTYSESNANVVKKSNNKKILMNSPSVPISETNEILIDIIPSGPSVANISMAIAEYLGCNPIVLIGQDLSYTDGKHHAGITVKSFDQEVNLNSQTIEVLGYYGEKIKTTSQFYSMLSWFEQWIKQSTKSFYNCTEGGVWIHGCEHIPLKIYLDNQVNIADNFINERFASIFKDTVPFKKRISIEEYLDKIIRISNKLQTATYHSSKIHSMVKKMNSSSINYHLEELKKIDAFIGEIMTGDSLLNYLFASAVIDFENERHKMSENDHVSDSKSNLIFYKSIYKKIEMIKEQIKEIYSK